MFLICLLSIALITIAITTEKKSLSAGQAELIPVRVDSRDKIN